MVLEKCDTDNGGLFLFLFLVL